MKSTHQFNTFILMIFITGFMATTAFSQFQQDRIISPVFGDDGSVTFRLMAPAVDSVSITGSWMESLRNTEEMTKNSDGVWEFKLRDLTPDYYFYSYWVNGVRTMDPHNPWVIRDVINTFSAFILPGDESRHMMLSDGKQGSLHEVWYPSPTLEMDQRRMKVYLPPDYHDSDESYPVLYLLHGGGGDEEAWTELGLSNRIMDNLINTGKASPMIVVMANGNPNQTSTWHVNPGHKPSRESDSANPMSNIRFEHSLVKDVIPFVESRYRVKAGKANRAVTGLSMGGWQTQNLALLYPEMFDYFGVMSMGMFRDGPFGMDADEYFDQARKNIRNLQDIGYRLYWIACGVDDFLFESVEYMTEFLDGMDFEYEYLETGGGHSWDIWRLYLTEFAPMIFR